MDVKTDAYCVAFFLVEKRVAKLGLHLKNMVGVVIYLF